VFLLLGQFSSLTFIASVHTCQTIKKDEKGSTEGRKEDKGKEGEGG